ncbi:MAG: hypothetical protein RLZZ439_651, partial [Pseudomonadota bacterium]
KYLRFILILKMKNNKYESEETAILMAE